MKKSKSTRSGKARASRKPRSKSARVVRRIFTAVLALGITGVSLLAVLNLWVYAYASPYILTEEEASQKKTDCILVLGAGVRGDEPSYMLKDRLDCGISLYRQGTSERMLMSGDHGREGYDEVNVMKNFAKKNEVPGDDIFMDHAGFSTYESAYRAKEVFEVKSVIMVTQKYHLYRAVYDARRLGLDAYGVAAQEYDYPLKYDIFNNARECLARAKDFVWCIIQPKPTFLGEAIPISQSGALTDDLV